MATCATCGKALYRDVDLWRHEATSWVSCDIRRGGRVMGVATPMRFATLDEALRGQS